MMRTVVLLLCLATAGGIAGYTHYSRDRSEPAPVYTVPQRAPEPARRPPAAATTIEPGDRVALARALQRELKRVGCYDGEITGMWTTSSRMAMKAFTDRVNATLPIDTPDQVLLSLVRGHRDRACGAPDKGDAALPAAGAAAALALTAGARPDAKAADGARPAAIKPAPQQTPASEKKKLGERTAAHGGPVPPEGIRERRPRRRTAAPRPPKVVRDILKVLGFN